MTQKIQLEQKKFFVFNTTFLFNTLARSLKTKYSHWFPPYLFLSVMFVISIKLFQVTKSSTTPPKKKPFELGKAIKRPAEHSTNQEIKRIRPTLITSSVSSISKKNENVVEDGFMDVDMNVNVNKDDEPSSTIIENPITESFAKLIDVCR